MSVDILQDKIRKLKNPSVVQLVPDPAKLPPRILEIHGATSAAVISSAGIC